MNNDNTSYEGMTIFIRPEDAIDVMRRHDKRGDAWHLDGGESEANFRTLEMLVDGVENTVEITLFADGTWMASAQLIIGPKEQP